MRFSHKQSKIIFVLKVFFLTNVRITLLITLVLGSFVSACSTLSTSKLGVSSSPRVYGLYDPIPKGGGTYKTGSPYVVGGRWYIPKEEPDYDNIGTASWYGEDFHGRKTANGEIYDMNALTAAHPTLPMPSYVYVTNLENGRTILVRVNDRGPYVDDRLIDLSQKAAKELATHEKGLSRVRVRYAGVAPLNGDDTQERYYLNQQIWSKSQNLVSLSKSQNSTLDNTARSWSVMQYR